jgi:8-oxo-dGTP pyrophosphatase MutT (NUDIX family)
VIAPDVGRRDVPSDVLNRLASLPQEAPPRDRADAAVLVLLRSGTSGLEVLAEQRVEKTGDPWSGQVGLPGGHTEPTDLTLTDTVLRELREEVGILPSALAEPPRFFDLRRARPSGLRVAVFATRLADFPEDASALNPSEVKTTFWLPLTALDHIESRPRQTMFGRINVDSVMYGEHFVWGFTLGLLQEFVAWLAKTGGPGSNPAEKVRPGRSRAL